MATDFRRIGGEIISAPLNENFRKLRNDISIANVNLAFSSEEGVKNTIEDMYKIEHPVDAQACYVISSGEFYRYSKGDNEWHAIMDIGQTFRQGFLNSGAVILEDKIKLKEGSKNILILPDLLLYFKNQPGDEQYLKGMYHLNSRELNLGELSSNAYSIKMDCHGDCIVHEGLATVDDPDYVYLGTVIVNNKGEVEPNFIFTMPDMAYTADRGLFIIGSQAQGLHLTASSAGGTNVNRQAGFYYDEGVNFIQDKIDNYPANMEHSSNYNLRSFELEENTKLYYMLPMNGIAQGLTESTGLIKNKYSKNGVLTDVAEGYFTIQQHLITPNGKNIIIYGTELYNSMEDAYSHINDPIGAVINFPYVEATRIVLGNVSNFNSGDKEKSCRLESIGRLSQVGTIKPEYADNEFKLYSGVDNDPTPAKAQFDLSQLYSNNYNNLYKLVVAPNKRTQYLFGIGKAYDYGTTNITKTTVKENQDRKFNGDGYLLADNADLVDIRTRLNDIENEIWKIHDATQAELYRQGLRYRLYKAETQIDTNTSNISNHATILESKADKTITINGQPISKNVVLTTNDIEEKNNLYYTDARVQKVTEVKTAKEHYETKASSSVRKNPHNLYTDDLNDGTNTHLVSTTQLNAIKNLPSDTKTLISDLDARTMDYITIDTYDGDSAPGKSNNIITSLGDVKRIRFYERGVSLHKNNDILEIDCIGHFDNDQFLTREKYATMSDTMVDGALYAEEAHHLKGIDNVSAMYYYGTDINSKAGFHKLSMVTTAEVDDDVSLDDIVFTPTNGSIGLEHLNATVKNLVENNYHTVYDDGVLQSNSIDTFKFGDNLTVKVDGNIATINAIGTDGPGTTNFTNLDDVNVIYTGNAGKMLVVNDEGTGITVSTARPMSAYMLTSVYGEGGTGKVQHAIQADSALSATTASNALKVNGASVDDSVTTPTALWTSAKIQRTINSAMDNCYKTYYGTSVPVNISGSKEGDIYIMVE